jgi:type IV pilus assembly protein PilA
MKNEKGFTLIELLAVIVVLAVIMLVATTAVVPMMNRAQKQAFITDAQTIIKGAESYFIYKDMTGGNVSGLEKQNTQEYDDTNYGHVSYKCVDINVASSSGIDDLLGEYVEEKGKESYYGTVVYDKIRNFYQIYVTDGEKYIFTDWKTDGKEFLSSADETIVKETADDDRFESWNSGWPTCETIKNFVTYAL